MVVAYVMVIAVGIVGLYAFGKIAYMSGRSGNRKVSV